MRASGEKGNAAPAHAKMYDVDPRGNGVEERELLEIELLSQLSQLDAMEAIVDAEAVDDLEETLEIDVGEKQRLLRSALELVAQLESIGGGTLGFEKLRAIRVSLEEGLF